ncbi:MAG: hypothetical protein B1H08_04460 [Candidatus Omnitrophica bacterium 4484_171]|nr:MAG: hypothetical protein B1H08_04460 [Candidatus Omnitrophica bacterium 4484_171]
MIVKMAKTTIIIAKPHIEEALLKLRKFGLLHIKYINPPEDNNIAKLNKEIQDIDRAVSIIKDKKHSREMDSDFLPSVVKDIISLEGKKIRLIDQRNNLEDKLSWFNTWGKVSPGQIKELEKWDVFFKFYVINKRQLKAAMKDNIVFVINEGKGKLRIALISQKADRVLMAQEEYPPDSDYAVLREKAGRLDAEIRDINSRLDYLSRYRKVLDKYRKSLVKRIEFYKVRSGMAKGEDFWYLQGFVPKYDVARLKQIVEKEGWGMLTQDPKSPEEVPTLIRNPRWVSIIEPVFKFMGTVPGYAEYDISIWFLIFLTLFFAILIGDAGYGMLFLGGIFVARKKLKNLPSELFSLMYVFSTATIIWGLITGTWFGVEKIGQLPVFKFFVIQRMNSFVNTSQQFVMHLCFVIGAVHLTVAHSIVAFKSRRSLFALAQIGWIALIWGLFFVAGKFVTESLFPLSGKYLLIIGAVLVFLFSHPQRNILKAVGRALMDVPLKMISSFGDVVSYLRLFAVGYATVVVAASFNNMALTMGFNSIVRSFGAALILFSGHALNIILGFMAIIVHGVRLNMLEFSSHLGMEWSGIPYAPFRE